MHSPSSSPDLDRRQFVAAALATAALAANAPGSDATFELAETSLDKLRRALELGKVTSAALVTGYLKRIASLDRRGPALNSVIELNPDALAIAKSMDAERRDKKVRGPLHGVPILIKDNIDTADRMATTAGSLALVGARPAKDAFLVSRLRAAGAVILGKTNLSEWANFRGNRSTSGWSGRGGLTRNPYAVDRNPSGSSSGSGVAAAASLCAAAVGTETDGSIMSPSSVNGVVGLKPTVGLISRSGVIPISRSQDTAGPMARTVRDVALLLSGLVGVDPEDASTAASKDKLVADYAKSLDPAGLKGARLGVLRLQGGFIPQVDAVFAQVLADVKKQGAELIDPVAMPSLGRLGNAESTVLRYEFKAGLNEYFAKLLPGAPVKTLKDVIDFNERVAELELRYFGQQTMIGSEEKGPLTSKEYLDALDRCRRATRNDGIDAVMERYRLDAIIVPTTGPAGVTDLLYGDRGVGGSSTIAAVAGYPAITVPAGFIHGLPVGVTFFGKAWSEPVLLKLAYAYEQATKRRRPPRYLSTAEVG